MARVVGDCDQLVELNKSDWNLHALKLHEVFLSLSQSLREPVAKNDIVGGGRQ